MKGIAELRGKHREAEGDEERFRRQRERGKKTARERIAALSDPGSFVEMDKFVANRTDPGHLGDGVIAGHALIHRRPVFLFAQDFTVHGGSLSETNARKIVKVMDLAAEVGCPVIGLNDSGGARIQEGVQSLAGYAEIFLRNVLSSGVIPQISLVLGPCAGGAVYSPAITDFVLMVDGLSHMFITGPEVIKTVTKEVVTKEELGGGHTHSERSGVAHLLAATEDEAFAQTRRLLEFLPQSNREKPPRRPSADRPDRDDPGLNGLVPPESHIPYDVREIILRIADEGDFFEIQEHFARNIVIGFARFHGYPVGVVANQPLVLAGCLDIDASVKAARFVRCCDAFNIPLLTLVDVPGFLPGTKQEFGGIIRHGAKLLYAYAEATVPKITIITRKAYGGAYDVMSSKHIRGDLNLAYPTAEVAVMGPEGAVSILHKDRIRSAPDPAAEQSALVEEYRKQFANPWTVASLGYIDAVIEPAETRLHVIRGLEVLQHKRQEGPRRKHGNIPL